MDGRRSRKVGLVDLVQCQYPQGINESDGNRVCPSLAREGPGAARGARPTPMIPSYSENYPPHTLTTAKFF